MLRRWSKPTLGLVYSLGRIDFGDYVTVLFAHAWRSLSLGGMVFYSNTPPQSDSGGVGLITGSRMNLRSLSKVSRGKNLVKMSAGLRFLGVYCGTRVPASTCSSIHLYDLRSMCLVRVPLCDMFCSVSAMAARL